MQSYLYSCSMSLWTSQQKKKQLDIHVRRRLKEKKKSSANWRKGLKRRPHNRDTLVTVPLSLSISVSWFLYFSLPSSSPKAPSLTLVSSSLSIRLLLPLSPISVFFLSDCICVFLTLCLCVCLSVWEGECVFICPYFLFSPSLYICLCVSFLTIVFLLSSATSLPTALSLSLFSQIVVKNIVEVAKKVVKGSKFNSRIPVLTLDKLIWGDALFLSIFLSQLVGDRGQCCEGSLLVSRELDRQTCRLILTDMNALDCVWHLCCVWGA